MSNNPTQNGNPMDDIEILAQGLQALRNLQEHADRSAGIPILTPGACRPCMNFVARLLRGEDAAQLLHLRCEPAQAWHQQVQNAYRVADRVAPR